MNQRRFFLIDLFRTLCVFAIVLFHSYSTLIFTDYDPEKFADSLFPYLLALARVFSLGGFFVLGLTFFLLGLKRISAHHYKRMLALVSLGTLFLIFTQGEHPFELFLEWDIYQFILVSVALVGLQSRNLILNRLFTIIGFLMLWIPFWRLGLEDGWPITVKHIVIGVCDREGRGGWSLLPWIGYPAFFFGVGSFLNSRISSLSHWQKHELWLWVAMLVLSVPFLGDYYVTPIGPGFYCHMYRQSPIVFFAHHIWFLFLLRCSFVAAVNQKLGNLRWIQFISNLKWNQSFGLTYFISLIVINVLSWLLDENPIHFYYVNILIFAGLVVPEVLSRIFLRLKNKT